MDIWHGLDEVPDGLEASVVTIGTFDGIHRGHRRLIAAAVRRARELGVGCVMITFDPHPLSVIRPDRVPPMLTSVADRAELAAELGVDHLMPVRFTRELAAQSPQEFFDSFLRDGLRARAVLVGANFTYGHRAAGTTDTLRSQGTAAGIEVDVVDLIAEDGRPISSTWIRELLAEGAVDQAAWALGRPYPVTGQVVHGRGRGGAELGFPTANLDSPRGRALPTDGVYAGWVTIVDEGPIEGDIIPGHRYPAAVSVGTNLTFDATERTVEAFILDRSADLYHRTARVEFISFLRPMLKFDGVDALVDAMGDDVARTRVELARFA